MVWRVGVGGPRPLHHRWVHITVAATGPLLCRYARRWAIIYLAQMNPLVNPEYKE